MPMSSESSARSSSGRVHESDVRPTAEQACKECRRRKSKCDRMVPVCALCHKFKRRCSYEKQTKTPLTRRYLNEVESELVRTKALLQQFMNNSKDGSNVNFGAPAEDIGQVSCVVDAAGSQLLSHPESSDRRTRPLGPPASPEVRSGHPTSQRATQETRTDQQLQYRSSVSETGPQTLSCLSLEPPSSPTNFEWDERNGNSNGERFVDGMASLTSASHEGGYLGVASGAALLRATDAGISGTTEVSGLEQQSCIPNDQPPRIPFALSSLGQLEPFVDAYFSLFHRSYPIIHEATFRAQLMEVIPRPAGNAWQVLLFIVSAMGMWTTATQPTDADLGLFEAAKARLSIDMLETGNLVLVQALTIISNYMQKRNKPNSGYNYTGLARRIAMGIGLHKEFPNSKASLFTTEVRRRVWHCLYIFDVGAIITFSRPFDFPDDGIDVALPMNIHDPDFTQATKSLPMSAEETTVYTHMRAQAAFHMATSKIYSKIISSPFPSASDLLDMDEKLIGCWLCDLPPYFRESVVQEPRFRLCHSILRWRYRNFRILMYRPFLLSRLMARPGQSTTQDNHAQVDATIQRCLDAARESVELISNFWAQEQHNMMACWYGLYFLFQAILIPVICLRNDPQGPLATGWREQIHRAMSTLESMALLNPTAYRCLSVIRSRCGTYLDTSTEGWGHPTEESPQTQLEHLYPLMWPTLEMAQLDGIDSVL
ncbi:lactose regulatory protein lac9 and GAL4-like protein [Aspergillus niger]|nr:lactose regulatory protein lac9 and GAL4-like protein [Aspergillus niger]